MSFSISDDAIRVFSFRIDEFASSIQRKWQCLLLLPRKTSAESNEICSSLDRLSRIKQKNEKPSNKLDLATRLSMSFASGVISSYPLELV